MNDIPDWYKDAIIYEVRVLSFADSNGDGIGDLLGLRDKLGYLEDLGVTALWLLPICPSPLRDDGYDISDYTEIHPDVGTLDDFKSFLAEAHRRGIWVITELVLNHTSEQHPWFQRARRAPPGSPHRDFYVWSDTAERYPEARIIFKDFELSNWAWDPVAKAYFWHRFYSHQPDLNFESPDVREAIKGVVDFWFGMGVDGLRLDAVPYLFEQEGTNCENLPQTHEFLRELRLHVDQRFRGRMLLAEANQWPEDAAAYFGAGDECHMNFHFPIMPRIFMSIHMEDRLPIMDILAQTPSLPPTAQWALFLRNHDELTLEMVTDEERDYMYRAFASDPSARINLGIRRRLAPLVGNNRRNMELMNGLLFSLPGTPVLYYGDEIAMGDNIYLGDRNGVRTPMQWSADRNAGFSKANPQRLILPINIDPEYHFESLNVEAQQNNPNSLLWWTKRLISLRKRFRAFGRGTIEFLSPANPRVLAFIRHFESEAILVVANLSRLVQYVELDLARLKGMVPVELFGGTEFPAIGELPYLLTLGGHAFYWFALQRPRTAAEEAREAAYYPPPVTVSGAPASVFQAEHHAALERVLPGFLAGRRWLQVRGRELVSTRIVEALPVGEKGSGICLLIVRADYGEGQSDLYALPLGVAQGEAAAAIRVRSPQSLFAQVRTSGEDADGAILFDVLVDGWFASTLVEAMAAGQRVKGVGGELVAKALVPLATRELEPKPLKTEHRFATLNLGDRYMLKFYRSLHEGTSPELELGRFLACRPRLTATAPLVGSLEYWPRRGEPITLAALQGFIPGAVTAAVWVREELGRYFERVLTSRREERPTAPPRGSLLMLAGQDPTPSVREVLGTWVDAMRLLGRRVGELHTALADASEPAFAPEPYSVADQRSAYQSNRNLTGRVLRLLQTRLPSLPAPSAELARALLAREADVYRRFEPLRLQRFTGLRARYHGDLRLEKVLYTGKDFVVVGVEGDPARSIAERRRKRSPLRDIAGLWRSIESTASEVLFEDVREEDWTVVEPWSRLWVIWNSASLLRGYLETAGGASFLPHTREELALLLDRFHFEKALKTLWQRLTAEERVDRLLRALVEMLDSQITVE